LGQASARICGPEICFFNNIYERLDRCVRGKLVIQALWRFSGETLNSALLQMKRNEAEDVESRAGSWDTID